MKKILKESQRKDISQKEWPKYCTFKIQKMRICQMKINESKKMNIFKNFKIKFPFRAVQSKDNLFLYASNQKKNY